MKAAVITDSGLQIRDVPQPSPTEDQVLVRVRSSALNRADLRMASGSMHGERGGPGAIAGLEWAGDVLEVGEKVEGALAGRARRVSEGRLSRMDN